MASTEINGASASTDGMSAAERLMQKHAAEEAHTVTLEEVPDEEFVAHPPPSGLPAANEAAASGKAAGKQPAREQKPSKPALDTQSEEVFPALGAPKAPAAAAPSMWSKKPAAVGKAATNGVTNGTSAAPRPSAPSSGIVTPSSTAGSQRGPTPQMSLPGRYSEQIRLHSSMLTPKSQLKKPVAEVLREINKRSKANIEMKSGGQGGFVIFEGTGPVDAVRVALKEVANQLCAKVSLHEDIS